MNSTLGEWSGGEAPAPVRRPANRLRGLDGLRGIAVLMVLVYHYTFGFTRLVGPHRPGLWFSFYAGQYGVELFFIISGYVILMTVERSATLYSFAIGRFSRLYPPFCVGMLFTAALTLGTGFHLGGAQAADVPGNLVMVTYLFGLTPIDTAYWTLSFEFIFYVIISVALLGPLPRDLDTVCLAWLAVAYFCDFILGVRLPNVEFHPPFPLAVVTVAPYANLFVFGMMLYRLHAGRRSRLTYPIMAVCAVPVVVMAVRALLPGMVPDPRANLIHSALLVGFAVLAHLAPTRRIVALRAGPLPRLGDISYSLYLIHQFAGYVVIDELEGRDVDPNLAILVTACLAILVASLMRRAVERPAQRLIRAWAGLPRKTAG